VRNQEISIIRKNVQYKDGNRQAIDDHSVVGQDKRTILYFESICKTITIKSIKCSSVQPDSDVKKHFSRSLGFNSYQFPISLFLNHPECF